MKQVPIFWITVTATLFVGLVGSVLKASGQQADAEVHRWEIVTERKIVAEPDFSEVRGESSLYVLVFGDDARGDWAWTERSVLNLALTEYGYENVSDTRWCSRQRIPLPELRAAHACNLYLTWQPGVSTAPRLSGALPDLPAGYRVELVSVSSGLVGKIKDGRIVIGFFGVAYLFGCLVTLGSVRRRRNTARTP